MNLKNRGGISAQCQRRSVSCSSIIAEAEEADQDTNVRFEPVGDSEVDSVGETIDENNETFLRLYEAEFEIEEKSRKEGELRQYLQSRHLPQIVLLTK